MIWTKLSLRLKLLFALVPLLVAANVPVLLWNLRAADAGREGMGHARQVLMQIERVASAVKGAELMHGRYLMTGRAPHRSAHAEAMAAAGKSFEDLKALLRDNENQHAHLYEFERRFREFSSESLRSGEIRARLGPARLAALIDARPEIGTSEPLRRTLDQIADEENAVFAAHQEEFRRQRSWTALSLVGFAASALFLLSLVYVFWRRDQNHQIKASRSLEERDFRMRLIANNVPVIFWAVDSGGRYTFVQGKALENWGLGAAEILGRPFDRVNEGQGEFQDGIRRALKGRLCKSEFSVGPTWYESIAVPLDGHGGGAAGLLVDVTDIKSREDEALSANREKTRFLTSISHEIRSPLAIIQGFTEIAMGPETRPDERLWYLGKIKQNSDMLSRLLDDLVDLSKVEAGRLELRNETVDLGRFLKDLSESFGLKSREKGVAFKVVPSANLPMSVIVDPLRLRQTLLHLCGNAMKFTERGSVTVRASADALPGHDVRLKFRIQDTGIGISPEHQASLFRAFYQVDDSLARRHRGAGLGLSLARRLVNAMGGELSLVSSEPDHGSVFEFSVVAQNAATANHPMAAAEAAPGSLGRLHGLKILMVDDSPDNRKLVEIFLRNQGAAVTTADGGSEGVERAMRSPFDAILMDIQMPEVDGFAATRTLRERGYGGAILAFTAHALNDERARALSSGFNDYLTKPVQFSELVKRLESAARATLSSRDNSPRPRP